MFGSWLSKATLSFYERFIYHFCPECFCTYLSYKKIRPSALGMSDPIMAHCNGPVSWKEGSRRRSRKKPKVRVVPVGQTKIICPVKKNHSFTQIWYCIILSCVASMLKRGSWETDMILVLGRVKVSSWCLTGTLQSEELLVIDVTIKTIWTNAMGGYCHGYHCQQCHRLFVQVFIQCRRQLSWQTWFMAS